MTAFKNTLLTSILICFSYFSYSQIKITSPQNRAVYQRDNGYSRITIAGSYQQQVDKIEARFLPVEPGQGDETSWITIKDFPLNGNFSSILSLKQGWYTLEVRGSINGTIIGGVSRVDRVGVGEVFVISGQSNAEGVDNVTPLGAFSDRVNCFEGLNDRSFGGNNYISLSPFSKLNANTRIAPRGLNAWCWGRLGDLLVSRLNVPVMFFNTAFEGTSSSMWATTANGNLAPNPYIGGFYNNKLPYQNLSDVLRYFVTQLGVRSVLWCQGETDNYIVRFKQNISANTYKTNLQTVINRSRGESGKDISWVVSLTSATSFCPGCLSSPLAPSDNNILEGQRATIRETSNVFLGPETDLIQNPGRQDGVHFNSGLSQLADAWNNSLNDSFFTNSRPHLPTESPILSYVCGDGQVEITLPDGFSNYEWSNNGQIFNNGRISNQRKLLVQAEPGREYFARFTNANGNVIQMPAISFRGSNFPVASVSATGATDFCEGNKVSLKANDAIIYEWNTGSREKEITVTSSGSYFVRTISGFGCQSDFSTPVNIVAKPGPPKPIISANSSTIFCSDSSVTLQSSNQDAIRYLWSDGSTNKLLKTNISGTFSVRTLNSQGCISNQSDGVKVTSLPQPQAPSIVPNSSTTFCSDTSVVLTSSNQDAESYKWNTGASTRSITVKTPGDYSVKIIDKNGCTSKVSVNTKIKVNPLPSLPTITPSRDTVFCEGGSTILQMNIVNGGFATWFAKQNGTTFRYNYENLNVNSSGSFQGFQTDQNGCKSALTVPLFVSVKPIPAKVDTSNIVRLSPYTIAVNNPQANTYTWQVNGANSPIFFGSTIRFIEAAEFSVIAKNIYKTQSYGEKSCISEPSQRKYFGLFNDNGLSVYPNPSRGMINIDSKVSWLNFNPTIEVFNLMGELISKVSINVFDDVKSLNLTFLPEGQYMLRIKTDTFYTITKRIAIER
jgi:Secretion system C-terminal sorting domain/Carbohydrate esterase, sialic acid-specific acetylesterase